jgi:carboxymethylenebutenolidase
MPDVEFEANGGTAKGYLAEPEGEGPGLVMLGEWWGLDDNTKSIVDSFAKEGFVALAPDLYEAARRRSPTKPRSS